MHNINLFSCRRFKHYDETFRMIEIAIPVEVCECSAYKLADRDLDPLASAVLQLMNIGVVSNKEISDLLDISRELVELIMHSVLLNKRLIKADCRSLSIEGREFLRNEVMPDYEEEKVFGNMFISLLDGEVMPYFLEGKLPINRRFPREVVKLLPSTNRYPANDKRWWQPRFARAYRLFCRMNKYKYDLEDQAELEFVDPEFVDVDFEDVSEFGEGLTTLAEAEGRSHNSSYKMVRMLDTPRVQTWLKTEIVISRETPEIFSVVSPFPENVTNWYTKRLNWCRENGIKVTGTEPDLTVDQLLKEITQEFYIEFPEMHQGNFDYWLSVNYPNLKRISFGNNLFPSLLAQFNLLKISDQVGESLIIAKTQRIIETLFNNYIAACPNRDAVLSKCWSWVRSDESRITEIFRSFGITDCISLRNDYWKGSLKRFNWRENADSVADRYFFLVIDAYLADSSAFKRVLQIDGPDFIDKLDTLIAKRNRFGSHSDKVVEEAVSKSQFKEYNELSTQVIKRLIDAMYEEEQANG